jgi:carboxymethylenebutenolidase
MNTFRRSTFRWTEAATTIGALGFALVVLTFVSGQQKPPPKPPAGTGELPPFLEAFQGHKETPIVTRKVQFPSALGQVDGLFARPDTREPLPALLLVHDEKAWTGWMETNARNMAGIGYGVLVIDVHRRRQAANREAAPRAFTDEATLSELSAAVRWLRGRADVLPNRVGVVGWGWSGGQVLALAAATSVQGCVCCGSPIPEDPSLILGLRGTRLLCLFAGDDGAVRKALPAFRKALTAAGVQGKLHVADELHRGFLAPHGREPGIHPAADSAWVEIYEFLGKHVEGAGTVAGAGGSRVKPFATVADIMRAVNSPSGLRGALSQGLQKEPAGDRQWERVRANAALVAEAGVWLEARTPARGSPRHWKEQARAFTTAAEAIITAADRHDYSAARRGLQQLATRCAACHDEHR